MSFPSLPFLLAFLPAALAGYFLLGRIGPRAAALGLGLASLGFCAPGGIPALLALAGVIGGSYLLGEVAAGAGAASRLPLAAGLAVLALAGAALRGAWPEAPWAFAFVLLGQAAYLLSLHRSGPASPGFLSHALWSGFFPRLPFGPPLSRADWDVQRAAPGALRFRAENAAPGLGLLACGLAKKAVLADNLSLLARHLFDDAARQGRPGLFLAWTGTLAFAFQIYFELSGYADMARGAARMFNVALPPVFDAPYRARNLSAFWSRWYAPLWELGRGLAGLLPPGFRPLAPVAAFAALGLWHGASAPFLAWGLWSGGVLAVQRTVRLRLPAPAAHLLTLLAILAGWVVFRSATLGDAGTVLAALAGLKPAGESVARQLAPLFLGSEAKEYALAFLALAASPFVALLGPTSERCFGPGWKPSPAGALGTAALLVLAVLCLPSARPFFYAGF